MFSIRITILIIPLACILSLGAYDYRPVAVCIEITPGNKSMKEICKDARTRLSFQKTGSVCSIDTINDRIVVVALVYNGITLEYLEQVLYDMTYNKDYGAIDYYFIY